MIFALVVGTTETATIDGISAAGADPEATYHTPAADLEIVSYGRPVFAPTVPVSPSGCPTPAVITRSVRELLDFEVLPVEAGLATRTAAPTVAAGDELGRDVRDAEPVPAAESIFERARAVGRGIPDDEVYIGESVPGGTTTALGVLAALGEPHGVSSSLPSNPVGLKRKVVSAALDASDLEEGDAAGEPLRAVRLMGDPMLPAVAGLAVGAIEGGAEVTLAGGTQMVAAAALLRHFGVDEPFGLATTIFVDEDETADVREAARNLDVELSVTDPEFDRSDHVALRQYCRGEAKEGVGMGGALDLASRSDVEMRDVRERIVHTYEEVVEIDGP